MCLLQRGGPLVQGLPQEENFAPDQGPGNGGRLRGLGFRSSPRTQGNPYSGGEAPGLFGRHRSSAFITFTTRRANLPRKVLGARGHRCETILLNTRRTMDLGMGQLTHSFLVIPKSPYPLLGKDLLTKMKIHFKPDGPQLLYKKRQPNSDTDS